MDLIHDANISLNSEFGCFFLKILSEHVDCHAPLK